MWYADTAGLRTVYARVCEFHRQYGELWRPAGLLRQLALENSAFAEFDAAKEQRPAAA